jgi:hypothetical protein
MIKKTASLILAAGNQERWNAEPIIPKPTGIHDIKQLVVVKGEVLIERIQRQFPGSVVITNNKAISIHSKMVFKPETPTPAIGAVFSTHSLWKEWTTILLGDVDYGEDTIELINNQEAKLMFYGDKSEIYAIKWHESRAVKIHAGINQLINTPGWTPKFGKLWNLYRVINNIHFGVHLIRDKFTHVSDCRDFDVQHDYERYAKKQKIRK